MLRMTYPGRRGYQLQDDQRGAALAASSSPRTTKSALAGVMMSLSDSTRTNSRCAAFDATACAVATPACAAGPHHEQACRLPISIPISRQAKHHNSRTLRMAASESAFRAGQSSDVQACLQPSV